MGNQAVVSAGSEKKSVVHVLRHVGFGSLMLVCATHVLGMMIGQFHADTVSRSGTTAALGMDMLAISLGVHALGLLLTIPTLLGVSFGKCQAEKYASLRDVVSALPLVCSNGALAWGVYSTCIRVSVPSEALVNLTHGIPSNTEIWLQGLFAVVMSEVLNFIVHKSLHDHPFLYRHIHRIHHSWNTPVPISFSYAHPFEHILQGTLSVTFPLMLCGAHPLSQLAWILLGYLQAVLEHSGYFIPPCYAGVHDVHHQRMSCNYSVSGLVDYFITGTYMSADDLLHERIKEAPPVRRPKQAPRCRGFESGGTQR